MNEQTALVKSNELSDIMRVGATIAKSGYFEDAKQEAQAVVKVLAGQELGVPPIQAMTGIYIVKGRIALGANIMAMLIKRSGKYTYKVVKLTDEECEIVFYEGNQEIGKSSFTRKDAERAGTQNMQKFPRNMLFARAMSNGAKWYTPDVFGGPVYVPEELGDGSAPIEDIPEGVVIDSSTGEIVEQPQPTQDSGERAALRTKIENGWKALVQAGDESYSASKRCWNSVASFCNLSAEVNSSPQALNAWFETAELEAMQGYFQHLKEKHAAMKQEVAV